MRYKGKTAVVTAGANGIGLATAKRLRSEGANVAIIDIAEVDMDELSSVEGPGEIFAQVGSVTDPEVVAETADKILERFGRVDVFVANAGGSGPTRAANIEEITDDLWQFVMDLNVTNVIRYCRKFVPGMRDSGWGRIVLISSGAKDGVDHPLPPTIRVPIGYATAKAGLCGMAKQLAKDLGPEGITTNVISPGMIISGGGSNVTSTFMNADPAVLERIVQKIPVGRTGKGEDIAGTVAYLASDEAGFVNGEVVTVNGGM